MAMILIVDDTKEILSLTKMILGSNGYEVELAKNSEECFEKIEEKKPDLILLDVMLSKNSITGWDVCRKIKEDEKTHNIPIAMFTVRSSEDDMGRSQYCGADAHINKPFKSEELLRTIEDLIKKSSS